MQPNTLVTRILELSREDPNYLKRLEVFRRAVTVMFTDIMGSTEYFEKFGDIAGLALVRECNDLLREVVEHYQGGVIKTVGDAIMAVFDNCNESIRAAVTMQKRLQQANVTRSTENQMLVRIGMHFGIGIVKSDDIFGDVVNVASRVESVAHPGQIVISDSLRQQISSTEFEMDFLGRFRLKGKTGERDLFEVRWSDNQFMPLNVAHTIVSLPTSVNALLQHLRKDGSVAAEYRLSAQGLTLNRINADLNLPDDRQLGVAQPCFSLEQGQPMVEDVSCKGNIFIRLIATYTLEHGDVIAMGQKLFDFLVNSDIVSAATTLGRTLANITDLLNESAAEFVTISRDGCECGERYPLRDEEVRFGRTTGTYIFKDDPLMSRSHARVYHRGEDFFLEDLHTRNGTFVRVRGKAPVPFGAVVLVGRQAFRVVPS